MPAVGSCTEFFDLLEQSNLIPRQQVAAFRHTGAEDPRAFAKFLVRKELLTKWQAQQLLAGSFRLFLGKYKLLDKLGAGGMGAVYKAQHALLNHLVAVKVMSNKVLEQSGSVERFHQEIRTVSALDHPNVVRAIDADCVGITHFLVMEYVQGNDLNKWLKEYGRLPIDWSCECIRQAAIGLQHAHERGLVHRDIKPGNLLVLAADPGTRPQVKILDLGLAKFTNQAQCDELTKTGQVLGTIDYISPEQARDTSRADIRSDIFSLGCTLFKLLSGHVPFGGKNSVEKLMARAFNDAPPISKLRRDVPQPLDAVVQKMLARDPDDRFQQPVEVADALAPFSMAPERPISEESSQLVISEALSAQGTGKGEADETLHAFFESLANTAAEEPRQAQVDQEEPAPTETFVSEHASKSQEAATTPPVPKEPSWFADRPRWIWILAGSLLLAALAVMAVWPKTVPPAPKFPFDENQAQQYQQAWAEFLGLPVEWTDSAGIRFVLIPPGEFMDTSHNEIRIEQPFYLGVSEVTQAQYQAQLGKNPAKHKGEQLPVEQISRADIQAFCEKLSSVSHARYRLPAEVEWEFACRAGTSTNWFFGDKFKELERFVWLSANSKGQTQPVASLEANPFGLYDIYGNVWEWCRNDFARGGSVRDGSNNAQSGSRIAAKRQDNIGFRVVREIDYELPESQATHPKSIVVEQTEGPICIEAESYQKSASYAGQCWRPVQAEGASGGFVVTALPDWGNGSPDEQGPRLEYRIKFAKPGRIYVWVRAKGTAGTSDSFHAGIDGKIPAECNSMQSGADWKWVASTMKGKRPQIVVSSAGEHVFCLWMREDGAIVDRIILSRDPNYRPPEPGPSKNTQNH